MYKFPLEQFLEEINKDNKSDFYTLARNSIIGFNDKKYLKELIDSNKKNQDDKTIYIRGVNEVHEKIYKKLYGKNVVFGKCTYTNDIKKIIKNVYQETDISEYLACHIWGYSRNLFWSNELWNVWYIPRFIYYLTDKSYGNNIGLRFRKELKQKLINNIDIRNRIIECNNFLYKHRFEYQNIFQDMKVNKKSLTNVAKQLVMINVNVDVYDYNKNKDEECETIKLLDKSFNAVDFTNEEEMKRNFGLL